MSNPNLNTTPSIHQNGDVTTVLVNGQPIAARLRRLVTANRSAETWRVDCGGDALEIEIITVLPECVYEPPHCAECGEELTGANCGVGERVCLDCEGIVF